jgi:hypothetical protein
MTVTALETGWSPQATIDDTLTRRFLFHWSEACRAIVAAAGGKTLRTPLLHAADTGRPNGMFNVAVLLQPMTAETTEEMLATIDETVGDRSSGFELWSLWPTPDLSDDGWELVGHPPLMARPPAPAPVPARGGPVVTPVRSVAELASWEQVVVEGFPLDSVPLNRPGVIADPTLLADSRLRFWIGREQGQPVSIGTLFTEPDLASFLLGVTRPEARGRGHWAAHAAARLATVPDRWVTGVFSDYSRPLAERIGFVPITRFTLWTLKRR